MALPFLIGGIPINPDGLYFCPVNVYFIPGLAADRRVFRYIQLPGQHQAVYLDWIRPLPGESLAHYAQRMAEQVEDKEPFCIIGLSLGGMVASEIVRQRPNGQLILVASIPHAGHLPGYYRWMQKISLQRIVPISAIKSGVFIRRFFTTESPDDKAMLREMIRDADPYFIRWSLEAVLQWDNKNMPESYIHIHGTRDIVLPHRYTRPTHIVRGGSHLMIFDRANDINQILASVLGEATE